MTLKCAVKLSIYEFLVLKNAYFFLICGSCSFTATCKFERAHIDPLTFSAFLATVKFYIEFALSCMQ